MNPLNQIKRYDEIHLVYSSHIGESENGEFVKYADVEEIINNLIKKHQSELDDEYSRGCDKGLYAAYISNQSSGIVNDPR
jgi:hypothetical protein